MKQRIALLMRGAAPVLILATALLSRLVEFPYWLALVLLAAAGLLFLAASKLDPRGRRDDGENKPD